MNYIDSVEIEGFWGRKNVSLKLHRDLNFLIGPNGSGKTTIINLVSAVLRGDIPALYSVRFDKVTVKMKTVGANRKPLIEVAKVIDPKMGSVELVYTIKEKASEKGVNYGVEGPYDERIYSNAKYVRSRMHNETGARLSRILSGLVEVNWLSIHRASAELERHNRREDSYQSSIDHKLQEISRAFSNFFSLLNSKAETESKNFQEHVFLSLLDQKHSNADVFRQEILEVENKHSVVSVLRDLGVSQAKATRSVNAHYARAVEARKRLLNQTTLSLDEAISLSDAARVNEMLKEWRDLQSEREAIFQPRIQFEAIINKLFTGKELHFDERNTPMVHLESEATVGIEMLSSGEKQLFIILGEALLQEERPVVFISDEPELSLHVSWQSALFGHIRSLNKSCQIISATHSPDIVGAFQDRVINVEECILDVR